jgi:hypothetical protein
MEEMLNLDSKDPRDPTPINVKIGQNLFLGFI